MFPADAIREVRNRSDIVKIVSRHVDLKRRGHNHFGLCPFHAEKTPSFSVHPGKQIFHCFGCGETGDVFEFLTRVEGRSFQEVLRALASDAGVTLPEAHRSPQEALRERERRSERERMIELNDRAAELFRTHLLGSDGEKARTYLDSRGIGRGVSERFRLGFAPESWDTLVRWASKESVPLPLMERLGLILARRDGSGYYDRFRGRVMFPLMGPGGEVIGFGGRILANQGEDRSDEPKYMNTPETPLYRKGEALYGIHAARRAMSQSDTALIVEGNFDVLMLHEAGIENAIAPMGTALTERQVLLLKRFAGKAIALFDGDAAGRQAARKSVPIFVEAEIDARVALLPDGEDPDSFVRKQGREALDRKLKSAVPVLDHALESLLSESDRTIPGRVRVLEEFAPLLAREPNETVRDLYASRTAEALEIDPARVRQAIRQANTHDRSPTGSTNAPSPLLKPIPAEDRKLLGLLADHPALAARFQDDGVLAQIEHDDLRQVVARICDMHAQGTIDWKSLVNDCPEPIRKDVESEIFSGGFAEVADPERAMEDCLASIRAHRLVDEIEDLRKQAKRARERGNEDEEQTLARRAMELDLQRRRLFERNR